MNCFDETMGRVLSWLCLSGMVVSFVFLVVCFVMRGFADLRQRVHRVPFLHLVFLSFAVGYMTEIGATKTNQQNNLIQPMMTMPRIAGLQAIGNPPPIFGEGVLNETVSEDELSRGYYLEAVVTNDFTCVAPTNMALVGNWHRRGTLNEWIRLEFGGFEFPYGTNAATRLANCSVFSDGKIRPTPRDIAHEIAAVGSPMLAIEGVSSFGVAETDGGGRLLCWNDFFGWDANAATTTGVVNAQIELRPSGDFTTRSNNVEKIYRRIYPFDWDGDGLANEIDPAPRHRDGDFFGSVKPLPEDANEEAYYYLALSVTGRYDYAMITAVCDGASDLGDHVIVARTNQICRIPLLAGATYTVDSTLPYVSVETSTNLVEVVTNAGNSLAVSLPVAFEFEEAPPTRSAATQMMLRSAPIDIGARLSSVLNGCCSCETNSLGFVWTCSNGCACDGDAHGLLCTLGWEGYSFDTTILATCPCSVRELRVRMAIEERGMSLRLLDSAGNEIPWENPVLVGESVRVEMTLGGAEMTLSEFVGLFSGRVRLKAWLNDLDGERHIATASVPVAESTTTRADGNVFIVVVPANWLQTNRIVRNDEDDMLTKTSIDMSAATDGDSSRQDSDFFDANAAGVLAGRARGMGYGNANAAIPEGAMNLRTVRAGGTGSFAARVGTVSSAARQCQQQADVFFYSGHGSHDNGKLHGVALPESVSNYWSNIEVAVFAGCSVLDVGDRENNYQDPTSHAANPGLKWLAASGATTLLGYAYKAPLDNQGGLRIVEDWCRTRTAMGDVAAWMKANDNRNGRNACAIIALPDGRIEYRYFRKEGRSWMLRNKYTETIMELEP